jgi:hypothetical protein
VRLFLGMPELNRSLTEVLAAIADFTELDGWTEDTPVDYTAPTHLSLGEMSTYSGTFARLNQELHPNESERPLMLYIPFMDMIRARMDLENAMEALRETNMSLNQPMHYYPLIRGSFKPTASEYEMALDKDGNIEDGFREFDPEFIMKEITNPAYDPNNQVSRQPSMDELIR